MDFYTNSSIVRNVSKSKGPVISSNPALGGKIIVIVLMILFALVLIGFVYVCLQITSIVVQLFQGLPETTGVTEFLRQREPMSTSHL